MNGELRLILLGCGAFVCSAIVAARNPTDVDLTLLATVGMGGGVAIIANALLEIRNRK